MFPKLIEKQERVLWVIIHHEYFILQCVACVTDDQDAEMYPYGITSLTDKRDFLQKGDAVKFQIAAHKRTGLLRAVNIAAIRKFTRARVDSVKGQVMQNVALALVSKSFPYVS